MSSGYISPYSLELSKLVKLIKSNCLNQNLEYRLDIEILSSILVWCQLL